MKTELVEVFIAQGLLKWNLDLLFFSPRLSQNKYFDIFALNLAFQDQRNILPSLLLR